MKTTLLVNEDNENCINQFGGVWTSIKLELLKKYLHAFTTALKERNFRKIYIDAFAGTGRCGIKGNGGSALIDGSVRIALGNQPHFDHFIFIEMNKKKAEELHKIKKEFPSHSIAIMQSDANKKLQEICVKSDWKNNRAVLFLDPFGMSVDWKTLEAISKTKAIDVWYLFPYSALYRQAAIKAERITPEQEAAITRCLGTTEWREKFYEQPQQLSLFGDQGDERTATPTQMLDYVSERLRGIFKSVSKPKILSLPNGGAPLFALYFCVSNPSKKAHTLAMKIANDILKET